jgi:xanthine dehydrogenase YagS FAD-binding subunit
MKSFELYEPTTVADAVGMLDQFGATGKAVGGGSDLIGGIMKDWVQGKGMPYPVQIVDLTTIPDLKGIKVGSDGAHIGATTTLSEVIESNDLQQQFPLLTQAALTIASPLIRNFGTLGGNINQRPRCWFFRGENFNCYKKGGDFCYSVTGDNRYHAIIGGELCYIVHPSDTSTALLALNAQTTLVGPGGATRSVPFDQYFHGPREDVLTENVLKPNEVMTEVFIPTPAAGSKMAWTKLKDRQVYDFALVSVAAVFTTDASGAWQDGRITLGGVSPVPYRAQVVEDALKGKDIKSTISQAAAQIRTVARPMSLNAYKVDIAQGLIERTVLQALGG